MDFFDKDSTNRVIGFKERRYIEELRILSKATAIDCIIDDRFERIIYIIKPGDMGLAIGKNGDCIKKMSKNLGKRIEMVEYAEDTPQFILNMFRPIEKIDIKTDPTTENMLIILPKRDDIGFAIGKNGATIERARLIVRKYYGKEIEKVVVSSDIE
ncbi:MAG TPA: NusA-like transcription termination signal-binding factor [Methanocorpusculum sp.]|nr:NusA-like transcription termination signal-binding factor [Methanocorpusculum sp.]